MPGVSQNTGSSPSGGGGSNSSSSSSSKNEEKKCIVRFFPCDGWKGEYGFDWFRTEDDPIREEVDEEGTKASAYYDCIGKYTGGIVKNFVLSYHKEGDIAETLTEKRNMDYSSFGEVDNDVHFATYYLTSFRMKIPVVKEGEKYFYFYYVPQKGDNKKIVFMHKYSCKYEIEYEGDSLKQLVLTKRELTSDYKRWYQISQSFGPGDRKKAKSKDIIDQYDVDPDLIDRVYDCKNMFESSLSLHNDISYVVVTPDSYKKLELVLKDGDKKITQTFEFENRKLFNFIQRTDDDVNHSVDIVSGFGYQEAKKKAENEGVDENLLNPDCTLGYVTDFDELVSGLLTIHNAEGQENKLNVTKTMVDGEEVLTATIEEGGDEEYVLHPYWKDYYNGRGFTYKLENDSQHLRHYYFYPTLNLSYFDGMGKYPEFKREAKIQVTIEGEYDKITFEPSHKNVEVSPKTLQGNGTVTVKVKGDTFKAGQRYAWNEPEIIAKSEGVMVGKLKMWVFSGFPVEHINNCLDIVSVGLKASEVKSTMDENNNIYEFKQTHNLRFPSEATKKKERSYSVDNEHFKQLLAQAGVYFQEVTTNKSLTMEYEIAITSEDSDVPNYSLSAGELDYLNGDSADMGLDDVPDHYLDFEHSSRVFERYTVGFEVFEKLRTFQSTLVETKDRPTLKEFIDRKVVSVLYTIIDHMRIYLVDQFLTNNKKGADHQYFDDYTDRQQESALVFIKSVDANNHKDSNVVAHAIFKAVKLKDLFSNRNDYTFKAGSTTNLMDSSQIRYTLMPFQWKDFHLAMFPLFLNDIPKMRHEHTLAMIHAHTTPNNEEEQ